MLLFNVGKEDAVRAYAVPIGHMNKVYYNHCYWKCLYKQALNINPLQYYDK
jgi:hypothetical protein